jgi:hypothetical protein
VLTHACVMCFEKKNRKLAPFFNLYKERKKTAQKKKKNRKIKQKNTHPLII